MKTFNIYVFRFYVILLTIATAAFALISVILQYSYSYGLISKIVIFTVLALYLILSGTITFRKTTNKNHALIALHIIITIIFFICVVFPPITMTMEEKEKLAKEIADKCKIN